MLNAIYTLRNIAIVSAFSLLLVPVVIYIASLAKIGVVFTALITVLDVAVRLASSVFVSVVHPSVGADIALSVVSFYAELAVVDVVASIFANNCEIINSVREIALITLGTFIRTFRGAVVAVADAANRFAFSSQIYVVLVSVVHRAN